VDERKMLCSREGLVIESVERGDGGEGRGKVLEQSKVGWHAPSCHHSPSLGQIEGPLLENDTCLTAPPYAPYDSPCQHAHVSSRRTRTLSWGDLYSVCGSCLHMAKLDGRWMLDGILIWGAGRPLEAGQRLRRRVGSNEGVVVRARACMHPFDGPGERGTSPLSS
jgi:hypothetical protein